MVEFATGSDCRSRMHKRCRKLELEWVLRSSYQLDRKVIAETLLPVLGLEGLEVEDRGTVLRAYGWYTHGLDFADALHLASSSPADSFVELLSPDT